MSGLTLAQRVLAIEVALAKVPHAFGGALALAYYAEPRATIDIDLNVFVSSEQFDAVARLLARIGVDSDVERTKPLIERDGQARLWWGAVPLDLFFAYDPFHAAAAAATRRVPFGGSTIPILAADHLIVCKTVFDRPKDWVDIEAMLEHGTRPDAVEVLRWVGRIVGDQDSRFVRVVALLTA